MCIVLRGRSLPITVRSCGQTMNIVLPANDDHVLRTDYDNVLPANHGDVLPGNHEH